MNAKPIAAAAVMALAAVLVYGFRPPEVPSPLSPSAPSTVPSPTPSGPSIETTSVDASVASVVLSDEYSALLQEQLDNMTSDQTDFNNQMQDQMASDVSQFLYD
jgi:hypothetical protein